MFEKKTEIGKISNINMHYIICKILFYEVFFYLFEHQTLFVGYFCLDPTNRSSIALINLFNS